MYTQEILDTGQRHIVKLGMFNTKENVEDAKYCVKRVRKLRIQSKCGKIRTRITPNLDTFYAMKSANTYPFNLLIKFMTSVRFFLYQWFCNMVTIWSGCLHCELRVISCKLSWNRNLWAVFTATSCYELRVELWNSKLQKSELNLETASYQKFLALFSKLSYLGNTS